MARLALPISILSLQSFGVENPRRRETFDAGYISILLLELAESQLFRSRLPTSVGILLGCAYEDIAEPDSPHQKWRRMIEV